MPNPVNVGHDSHITNLESDELIASELAQAQSAIMIDPEGTQAIAALNLAKAKDALHKRTMEMLEKEFGPLVIGLPRKTKFKTTDQLKAQGYVGIYRRD